MESVEWIESMESLERKESNGIASKGTNPREV
jgi:hypothetical protein